MPSLITKPEYKALMALCRRAEGIGAELDSDRYANALSETPSLARRRSASLVCLSGLSRYASAHKTSRASGDADPAGRHLLPRPPSRLPRSAAFQRPCLPAASVRGRRPPPRAPGVGTAAAPSGSASGGPGVRGSLRARLSPYRGTCFG